MALNGVWFWLANTNRVREATLGMLVTFIAASLYVPVDLYIVPAALALVSAAMVANNRIYVLANALVLGRLAINTFQVIQSYPALSRPTCTATSCR